MKKGAKNKMKEEDKYANPHLVAFNQQCKNEPNEILPLHVLEGISKGQADIIAGRTINFGEFKKRLSISNT